VSHCVNHEWVERKRKPGTYMCKSCSALFPCPETDCGHFDCRERRPGTCYSCGGKVQDEDLFIVTAPRAGTKALHKQCYEKQWFHEVRNNRTRSET
jgi:hypothetical protein